MYVRLAGDGDERIYLDLGDASWSALRITKDGWDVVASTEVPVRFVRARGMLPLPIPERGGSMNLLRPFLNVPDEPDLSDGWVLQVAWLLGAFRPRGPFAILNLQGEQGGGKSTAERVLRACIDPNSAPLRSQPREERDLMIAANNGWVIALDNMSELKPWLSDALCRVATGGGFATRQLYTDLEETLIDAMRPIVTDGIEEYGTRADYLDRSLIVTPRPIPEERRKPEVVFWADFAAAHPRILGALLDAVSCALGRHREITLEKLPRMADFAIWVASAEETLGWKAGTFMAAYTGNRAQADKLALEASVIAAAVWRFTRKHCALYRQAWTGTATQLLAELEKGVDENTRAQRQRNGWPRAPHALAGALKRIAPNLRKVGVDIAFKHTKASRLITLAYTPSPDGPEAGTTGDPPWESDVPPTTQNTADHARETGVQNSVTGVTSVTYQGMQAPAGASPGEQKASPAASPDHQEASPQGQERHPNALFDAWGDACDTGDAAVRDCFPQGSAGPERGRQQHRTLPCDAERCPDCGRERFWAVTAERGGGKVCQYCVVADLCQDGRDGRQRQSAAGLSPSRSYGGRRSYDAA